MRNAHRHAPQLLSVAVIMLVALVLAAPARAAGSPPISGPEINELISGTTVNLHTPLGGVLPVLYRHNGTLTGRAGTMLSFYLGASRDEGKWWVTGSKLCQQWKIWFKGKKNCLDIRRRGADFHWDDGKGESGLATIVSRSKPVVASRTKSKKKHVRIGRPTGLGAPYPKSKKRVVVTGDATPARKNTNAAIKKTRTVKKPQPAKRKTVVAALAPVKRASLSPMPALATRKAVGTKSAVERWSERQVKLQAEMKMLSKTQAKRTARPRIFTSKNKPVAQKSRFRVVGVDPWDVLNVRKQAGPTGTIVATIHSESTGIQMTGPCVGDWCPVKHSGHRGWVRQKFLDRETRPNSQKRFQVVGVYDGDVLNIRRQPSATAPVAGAIKPDAKNIALTGQCSGEWCPIAHGRRRGWVHRYYIKPHPSSRE